MIYDVLLQAVSLTSIKVLAESAEEAKRYAQQVCQLTDAVKFHDDDVVEITAVQADPNEETDEDGFLPDIPLDGSEDAVTAMQASVRDAQDALNELSVLLRQMEQGTQ